MEERAEKQKAITMVTILHVTARTVCEERSWMETWFCISQWPSVYAPWETLQAMVTKPSGFACTMTRIPAVHGISSQTGRKNITDLPPFPHSTMLPRERKAEGVEANICLTDIHSNFKMENVRMQSTQSLTLTRRWATCAASFYDRLYKQLRLRETKALALEQAELTFI